MNAERLLTLTRGGVEEIRLDGQIVVVGGKRSLYSTSETKRSFPARSTLKPFQFLATDLAGDSDVKDRYLPSLGSVSGTKSQIEQLERWYGDEHSKRRMAFLKFSPMWPHDPGHRAIAQQREGAPKPYFHFCFSKHMAILESCERAQWDISTYTSIEHAYHKRLDQLLRDYLGKAALGRWVTDGCGLPTPVLDLSDLAHLYQRLATEEGALGRIRLAMLTHPDWVGGPQRVDTELMRSNPGAVVAKEGADGLLALGVLPSPRYPAGLGIVLKLFAGWLPRFSILALEPLLQELGLKYQDDSPSGHEVIYHYSPFKVSPVVYYDLSPVVSEKIAVWPGDEKYERRNSLDTLHGDHLTLSSIRTTVHVGTHTDAPNHFEKNDMGIDSVKLSPYAGPCQVIEVEIPESAGNSTGNNRCILPIHLKKGPEEKRILAPRILFKTGSFPDPNHFNTDFVSLSEEIVDLLAEKGVVLVGLDTPSIDPFDSKKLPAHHATARYGMAILEGVVLDSIPEGVYDLVALPLKLARADASPVRAVLWEL